MEFGINFDQTFMDLWHEMKWNFHENPCQIFYRNIVYLKFKGQYSGREERICTTAVVQILSSHRSHRMPCMI